jgi:Trypsin-co-occurring domain 2
MNDEPWVGLAEAIAIIRSELTEAMIRSRDQEPKLEVGKITMELAVELHRRRGVDGGVRAWVIQAGGSQERDRADVHRLTVTLTPTAAGGGPVRVDSRAGMAEPYGD